MSEADRAARLAAWHEQVAKSGAGAGSEQTVKPSPEAEHTARLEASIIKLKAKPEADPGRGEGSLRRPLRWGQ